jgi:O-methyltransferase
MMGPLGRIFGPLRRQLRQRLPRASIDPQKLIPEIGAEEVALIERFRPFTMTSIERQWALISAINYLNRAGIPGALVECGVWRGGNMMLAKQLCLNARTQRRLYLYDTFAGMPEPSEKDVSFAGRPASADYESKKREGHVDWAYASLNDVKQNFERAGLMDGSIAFIAGKVEETLLDPANIPDQIALLRLDTDWYESTKAELEILYPRLIRGGILIIDDYGHWKGARTAFDEYFAGKPVFMSRIDYTARLVVKQ